MDSDRDFFGLAGASASAAEAEREGIIEKLMKPKTLVTHLHHRMGAMLEVVSEANVTHKLMTAIEKSDLTGFLEKTYESKLEKLGVKNLIASFAVVGAWGNIFAKVKKTQKMQTKAMPFTVQFAMTQEYLTKKKANMAQWASHDDEWEDDLKYGRDADEEEDEGEEGTGICKNVRTYSSNIFNPGEGSAGGVGFWPATNMESEGRLHRDRAYDAFGDLIDETGGEDCFAGLENYRSKNIAGRSDDQKLRETVLGANKYEKDKVKVPGADDTGKGGKGADGEGNDVKRRKLEETRAKKTMMEEKKHTQLEKAALIARFLPATMEVDQYVKPSKANKNVALKKVWEVLDFHKEYLTKSKEKEIIKKTTSRMLYNLTPQELRQCFVFELLSTVGDENPDEEEMEEIMQQIENGDEELYGIKILRMKMLEGIGFGARFKKLVKETEQNKRQGKPLLPDAPGTGGGGHHGGGGEGEYEGGSSSRFGRGKGKHNNHNNHNNGKVCDVWMRDPFNVGYHCGRKGCYMKHAFEDMTQAKRLNAQFNLGLNESKLKVILDRSREGTLGKVFGGKQKGAGKGKKGGKKGKKDKKPSWKGGWGDWGSSWHTRSWGDTHKGDPNGWQNDPNKKKKKKKDDDDDNPSIPKLKKDK